MATPATLTIWLDQLSTSILEKHKHEKLNTRKLQDHFRKRVKRHNFGRTNQFEVENRLNGLEEKFQILSLNNLSDALRQRRIELRPFQNHWLPDVLDLFLHLSGNPAANQTLLELYRIPPRIGTPPPLRWKDLLADSPIDRNDKLWKIPDFRGADDSGYDEDFSSSIGTSISSPKGDRQRSTAQAEVETSKVLLALNLDNDHALLSLSRYQGAKYQQISETEFIRELLFFLRGYDTDSFIHSAGNFSLEPQTRVCGISGEALNHIVDDVLMVRQSLNRVVSWISVQAEQSYMAAMKHATERVVQDYNKSIDAMQQALIDCRSVTVASLPSTMSRIEVVAADLNTIARLLEMVGKGDSVQCLETLYSSVRTSQLCADTGQFQCLMSVLIPALKMYIKPIIQWMGNGTLNKDTLPPFIETAADEFNPRKIWNQQFKVASTFQRRQPNFLAETVDQILSCGKTSAFLHELRKRLPIAYSDPMSTTQFEVPTTGEILLPFAHLFEQVWQQFVENCLHGLTTRLKQTLRTHCNFKETLDAIQQLYFPRNGLQMHDIELKIFYQVDRCIDSWNDRFQLKDMLEDAFATSDAQTVVDSITIHSAYTSSRTMQSQRTSVKILSSLSFEYMLSWPLANIIDDASMTSYRRVALSLMQVRRAKYCLEQTGYISAVSIPLGADATLADQTFAQVLAFTLLTFVNTLFDSMMLSSIWPATEAMQTGIQEASTVDEMIQIHQNYIARLECSCLAAPRLKLLRQSLQSILDLCIRFSDLVSNPMKIDQDGSDHEASSFISAKSRNKSLRMQQYGSDEDEDDDHDYSRGLGDGYSSFIVLDGNTSIVKELRKVKAQYEKQVKFFVSGLRGVSKGGRDVADLDILADRLSWLHTR